MNVRHSMKNRRGKKATVGKVTVVGGRDRNEGGGGRQDMVGKEEITSLWK